MGTLRRLFPLLLALCLLSGCGGGGEDTSTSGSALELCASVVAGQGDLGPLTALNWGDGEFESDLQGSYDLDPALFRDGAICYARGVSAVELTVLQLSDAGQSDTVKDALLSYAQQRALAFTGYAPEQAAMAEEARVLVRGAYTALFICPDPEQASSDFIACFAEGWTPTDPETVFSAPEEETLSQIQKEGQSLPEESPSQGLEEVPAEESPQEEVPEETAEPPLPQEAETQPQEKPVSSPEPEETEASPEEPSELPREEPSQEEEPAREEPSSEEDRYDHDAVLEAWRSGDSSGLSEKNLAIYEGCARIIERLITPEMTPVEQELAIHDFMITSADYDPGELSRDILPCPDNDNPYGLIYDHLGICLGYSSTFQLFMDLLGIECITVPGHSSDRSGLIEEHAWNMVKLDGEWYFVDTTWDDPVGGSPVRRYFNVTSQFLRENRHLWDEPSYPEATSTRFMDP